MKKPDSWLKKAQAHGDPRMGLGHIHQEDGRLLASDGARAHIWTDPDRTGPCPCPECADGQEPFPARHLQKILEDARGGQTSGVISRDHLLSIARSALAIRNRSRQDLPVLRLSLNSRLVGTADEPDVASTECTLKNGDSWPGTDPAWVIYEKTGPAVDILLNPKYLAEALAGMGTQVRFSIWKNGGETAGMLYLASGSAEAVIAARRNAEDD